MNSGRKVLFWIGGVVGVLLLLACVLLAAMPLLINLDAVHGKIEARFHSETGGQVTFRKLDLLFLPRPHAVMRGGSLSFPDRTTLVFEALTVYPKLLPLLKGDIRPARVQISSPRMTVALSPAKSDKKNAFPFCVTDGQPEIPPAFQWLKKTEGLVIQVNNGLLNLTATEKQSIQFSKIDVSIDNAKGRLNFELTCAANLFNRLILKGQLDPTSLKICGTLSLKNLMLQELSDQIKLPDSMSLSDGAMDLEMDFDTVGFQNLNTTMRASAPSLGLSRGQRNITVKGARINGSIHLGEGFLEASLSDMTLDYPQLGLSGKFKMEKDTPLVRMHLEGKAIDVAATRSCALAFAGDIPAVNNIFAVVIDGHLPFISVDAHGNVADLSTLDRYTIRGNLQKGRISLPNQGLDLTNVEGGALISKGILNGQRLRATIGDIKGKEGMLTVALTQGATPFHLDIQVDGDLAEVHPILKRLVKTGAFAEDLRDIHSIEGQATATLRLDETESGLLVDVDASSCRLKAAYRSLPFPVIVEKGEIHYRQNHVRLRNVAGAYGQSNFFLASGLFDWQNEPRIKIESATGIVFPEEVHPLLSVGEETTPWLKKISDIKGRVSVHALDLKGPLMNPVAWQYQTDLEVEDFSLNAAFLPSPVSISTARVKARTGGVDFRDAEINILDADLSMTGKLEGPLMALEKVDATLSGNLGAKAIQYLYETLELPGDFMVQTPMTVHSGRAIWEKDAGMSFDGNLFFPNGPNVTLDVFYEPDNLNIRKLTVTDETSKASLEFLVRENLVNIAFAGILQKAALDGLFEKNQFLKGWIQGEMNARVFPEQSFSASAEGVLTGKDIPIYGLALPIKIKDFSLSAEGPQLRVASARMVLGENTLSMSGKADFSPGDPQFDVDVSTENVDMDKVLKFLKETDESAGNGGDPWVLPVRGTAHLMWDSLKIGGYTWHPFQGEITVAPEEVRVSVENAQLCGISNPGVLRITPDGIQMDFQLRAEKRNLNQCITCLSHERVIAEGTFDLEGQIQGNGTWENLLENLKGPLVFTTVNGKVKQDPALARVLSLLNVTDIFKGKLPTLKNEGLFYDLIRIKANLQDGKIRIHEGLMNSSAMDLVFKGDIDALNDRINLMMLASPFTMTDRLIRLIPVAGYILGGTLISVPVKVDGPMADPKVRILPLSEIGLGMWGIMKRTLETPVKIMEPFVGEEQKDKENEVKFW